MSTVMALDDLDLELEALRESMPSPEVEQSPAQAKKPKRPITAAAPVPLLLRALATAQWGYLDGYQWQGVRSTLRSIGDLVHYRYGQGTVTAWDVKRGTGLTERWVRECLYWLEDAGLIEWRRGGVYRGVPQAGWMRINKKALVDLIRLARPAKDQATRDRNARTRARLARLGTPTIKKQRERSRRSDHAELSADPTHKESGGSPAGVPSTPTPSPKTQNTSPITGKENTVATTNTKGVPESVRLTRLRDQYLRNQGITSPEDVAYAHRHMATIQDWDRKIATARRLERRPEEDLTDAQLW